MHHFEYHNGELHAEDVPLSKIAAEVGTPFYCYSTATLVRHYNVFAGAFDNHAAQDKPLVCFSAKANGNQAVLTTLAREGAGIDVVSGGELARALAATGKMVVFKMGHKGAVVITPDGETAAGVYTVDALKPTGAGDSFLGGFLSARRAGLPLETCLSRGAATAAIVVTRVGCAPAMPTPAEIDDFIQNQSADGVIQVRMSEQHGIELIDIQRQRLPVALTQPFVALVQATVDQHLAALGFQ